MFSVTLIGPDGVGKTTISKELKQSFKLRVKYLYMGMNPNAGNVMLPTTRWWESRKRRMGSSNPDESGNDLGTVDARSVGDQQTASAAPANSVASKRPQGLFKSGATTVIKAVGLLNRLLDIGYRQLVAWIWMKRGYIVIYDRHYLYDYYHRQSSNDNKRLPLRHRIHDYVLKHILVQPDLLIILDAPGQVVFARKGEFNPEFLEMRRSQYLELQNVANYSKVLDATLPLDSVVQNVKECILEFHQTV